MRKRKLLWGGSRSGAAGLYGGPGGTSENRDYGHPERHRGGPGAAGVTVLTPKDWEKTGALTVRDALERVPGLNVVEGGMTGNKVSLRGMGNGST